MATRTTQVHESVCDRCGNRVERGRPRIMIGPSGVAELTDQQTSPQAIDVCARCHKSAVVWWTKYAGEP